MIFAKGTKKSTSIREKRTFSHEFQDADLSPAMTATRQNFLVINQTFQQRIQENLMKQNLQESVRKSNHPKVIVKSFTTEGVI